MSTVFICGVTVPRAPDEPHHVTRSLLVLLLPLGSADPAVWGLWDLERLKKLSSRKFPQ